MRRISTLGSIVATVALLSSASLAASTSERINSNEYFTLAGTVIRIDSAERTLLIREQISKTLYLVEVPDGVTFKITFGRYMRLAEPGFGDVCLNERVMLRCRRDGDHLAKATDGEASIRATASR